MKSVQCVPVVVLAVLPSLMAQTDWTLQSTGVDDRLVGVDYGNGQFGAISEWRVFTSPDGVTWTPHGSASGDFLYDDNRAITYTGTHWFARDRRSSSRVYLTTMLPSLARPLLPGGPNEWFRGAASGNGVLVVVGINGEIRTSTNAGASWLIPASPTQEDLIDVVFDGASFVALGSASAILQSIDGLSWTQTRIGGAGGFADLEYGQGVYVAVGRRTMRSVDLEDWSLGSEDDLNAVEYGKGQFVAVGNSGRVVVSSDGGLSWNPVDAGVTAQLRGVAFGDGHWIAVGGNGLVIRSPDDNDAGQQSIDFTVRPAIEIRWATLRSHTYQVKWSYDMVTWFDFGGPVEGDGTTVSVFDRTIDADKKLYKVTEVAIP